MTPISFVLPPTPGSRETASNAASLSGCARPRCPSTCWFAGRSYVLGRNMFGPIRGGWAEDWPPAAPEYRRLAPSGWHIRPTARREPGPRVAAGLKRAGSPRSSPKAPSPDASICAPVAGGDPEAASAAAGSDRSRSAPRSRNFPGSSVAAPPARKPLRPGFRRVEGAEDFGPRRSLSRSTAPVIPALPAPLEAGCCSSQGQLPKLSIARSITGRDRFQRDGGTAPNTTAVERAPATMQASSR